MTRRAWFGARFASGLSRAWLAAVFAFLYVPIAALVVYSFSDSPVPNVWAGFTLRWYAALAGDSELLEALGVSLRIAIATACASVVLGTLAAVALVKFGRFRGRTLFGGMVSAPLVMPDVIIGLSLLLLLVWLQRTLNFPGRSMATIWMGHALIGMAYATVVVQARLRELNPTLEEAALDLGARPAQAFRLVTLPLIAPSLAAAWLLTFTISLDDVVLASFLSGPGSTTLPLVIFSRARLGLNPSINAVASVIVCVVATGIVVASVWLARRERRRAREALSAQATQATQAMQTATAA